MKKKGWKKMGKKERLMKIGHPLQPGISIFEEGAKMHSITKAKLNSRPKREYLVNILIMYEWHFHFLSVVKGRLPDGPADCPQKHNECESAVCPLLKCLIKHSENALYPFFSKFKNVHILGGSPKIKISNEKKRYGFRQSS